MPVENTDSEELRLRAHIRDLLLDYVFTHITTDHVEWTERAVSELLSQCLKEVPLVDPVSIFRLPEPFDALDNILKFKQLSTYEERLTAVPEVVRELKAAFKSHTTSCPRVDSIWDEADTWDYMTSVYRPKSPPAMTSRSRRESTGLGNRKYRRTLLSSTDQLVKSGLECLDEPQSPVVAELQLEDVLKMRLAMDPETSREMMELLKSTISMVHKQPVPEDRDIHSHNMRMTAFMRATSPPPLILQHRPKTPPLFSRRRDARSQDGSPREEEEPSQAPTSFRQLPVMLATPPRLSSPDEYLEMSTVVVNGWHAFVPLSSPSSLGTPSLKNDTTDELFLESSDGPEVFVNLVDSKMDEILMPRAKRAGFMAHEDGPLLQQGLGFGSFLGELIPGVAPRVVSTPEPRPLSPVSSLSMLNQPASTIADPNIAGSDESFDMAAASLYETARTDNPFDIIIKDRLNESDTLYMDVPDLPPPNGHPKEVGFYPEALASLVVRPSGQPRDPMTGAVDNADLQERGIALEYGFLADVKGMKPLNVELSWRPFEFGYHMPTNEEVIGVQSPLRSSVLTQISETPQELQQNNLNMRALFDAVESTSDSRLAETSFWLPEQHVGDDIARRKDDDDKLDFILTRAERRRAAGLSDIPSEDDSEHSDIASDHEQPPGDPLPYVLAAINEQPVVSFVLPVQVQEMPSGASSDVMDSLDFDDSNILPGSWREEPWPEEPHGYSAVDDNTLDIVDEGSSVHPDEDASFNPLSFPPTQSYPVEPVRLRSGTEVYQEALNAARSSAPSGPLPEPSTQSARNIPEGRHDRQADNDTLPSRRLEMFMALRATAPQQTRAGSAHQASSQTIPSTYSPVPEIPLSSTQGITPEIIDNNTLCLTGSWSPPVTKHRYLASMNILQKNALVRALRSRECAIELVERDSLGGADLILDPHTGVVFTSLLSLPGDSPDVAKRLSQLSWRHSHLLVVLESFSPLHLYRYQSERRDPVTSNVFSTPIMKAVKKLRRHMAVAEECNEKRAVTNLHFAFALSVDEAARLARTFGDLAEGADRTGVMWGDRQWLTDEDVEEEADLAEVPGMNRFAAAVVLTQMTSTELVCLTGQERLNHLGNLVGSDRIAELNVFLERQQAAMSLPASSPLPTTSSSSDTPEHHASGDELGIHHDLDDRTPPLLE